MLGSEIIAHLLIGQLQFLARLDPRTDVRPGQKLQVAFELEKLHLFDAETQHALGAEVLVTQ